LPRRNGAMRGWPIMTYITVPGAWEAMTQKELPKAGSDGLPAAHTARDGREPSTDRSRQGEKPMRNAQEQSGRTLSPREGEGR